MLFLDQAPFVFFKHVRLSLSMDPVTPLTPKPISATSPTPPGSRMRTDAKCVEATVARPLPASAGLMGPRKRTAFINLDFEEVKRTSVAYGVTINDVVLCAISGAVGSLSSAAGMAGENECVRIGMPVNVRLSPKVAHRAHRAELLLAFVLRVAAWSVGPSVRCRVCSCADFSP